MATQREIAEELVYGLPDVRIYPMMGDYVLYCKEKAVGCICDNQLFVKITPVSKAKLDGSPEISPYPGAKPRYLVTSRDKSFLYEVLSALADMLPAKKRK